MYVHLSLPSSINEFLLISHNVVAAWGATTPVPSAINATIDSSAKPPTASLNFNAPTNLTAPLSANESNSSFKLQKPPIGNKRGKH